MAFDELKENFREAEHSLKSYAESSGEYYKLKSFKFLMQGITTGMKGLLVGVISMIVLLFLSIAAALAIGEEMDSMAAGFLIVALIYVLIGLILYALRHKMDKPLLRKFSEFYFDNDHE